LRQKLAEVVRLDVEALGQLDDVILGGVGPLDVVLDLILDRDPALDHDQTFSSPRALEKAKE